MRKLFSRQAQPPLALFLVLVLTGFLLVVTGTATSVASESAQPRKQVIIDRIVAEQRNVGDLDRAVGELRNQVIDANAAAGRASNAADSDNQARQRLALEAGTVEVRGSGLELRLADAPRSIGQNNTTFDSSRIQDSDLQLMVNALFAVGAEAISINDNRVVAVTPIRAAGATIVVNYRPVNSPYTIKAIGVDAGDFEGTDIAERFEQWKERFDLGYEVDGKRNLTIPAYSGRVGVDLAKPVTQPSTTTSTGAG